MDPYAGTVEVLWGARTAPSRGPKPSVSLAGIAEAGVALADADGLAAVSMQRVAGLLDFTKMALYRYVPGKAELVALMVDTAIGPPPQVDSDGWRARLADWATALFAGFVRHPWLLEATVGARVMGPNELGWLEQAVAALDGTGLDGGERLDAAVVVTGHARTIAQQSAGVADPEARLASVLGELMRVHGSRFPALTAALGTGTRDQAFEFGLLRILDGLGVLIEERGGG